MIGHILRAAGRHVGTTTSDGVLVDDAAGRGGRPDRALRRPDRAADPDDVDVAVLETARGGIMLRGVGYESNDASVLTNVSSDHMDLHGIHTLPELAEVKSVIARITRPDGVVVLNADDDLVAGVARQVRAPCLAVLDGARRSSRMRPLPGRGVAGPTCSTASDLRGAARATAATPSWPSRTCRPRWAAWRVTTSPMRSPRPPVRGRWVRPASRSPQASGRFGAVADAGARPAQPVPPRRYDRRHRRLRPQRGGCRGARAVARGSRG